MLAHNYLVKNNTGCHCNEVENVGEDDTVTHTFGI